MPIEYSGGVVTEHTAVRDGRRASSTSATWARRTCAARVRATFVNDCLTNDLRRIGPGQAQYTLCCDDATGGVVDDLIAYSAARTMSSSSPTPPTPPRSSACSQAAAPDGIGVERPQATFGVLAVQGPRSARGAGRASGLPTDHDYMRFTRAELGGVPMTVCRTGYTGEHGYELLPRVGRRRRGLGRAARPAAVGVLPCGLGARDTLRTEMGYPLHGQDLSPDITPVQARLGWAVGWNKPEFWGREALLAENARPARRGCCGGSQRRTAASRARTWGSRPMSSRSARSPAGRSPRPCKQGIALALLDRAGIAEGDEVDVDVRGRPAQMRV